MPHKAAESKAVPAAKEAGHPRANNDVEVEDRSSTQGLASAPAALVLKQTTVFASMVGGPVSAIEALKSATADNTAERDWAESEPALGSEVEQADGKKDRWVEKRDAKLVDVMETIVE